MTAKRRFLLFLCAACVAFAFQGAAVAETAPFTFFGVDETTSQSAVFAAFLSSLGDGRQGDAAISVSNLLEVPPALEDAITQGRNDRMGGLTFYLYDNGCASGNPLVCVPDLIIFSTEDHPTVGAGVDSGGQLRPGGTYTVLLSEMLRTVLGGPRNFSGFGWVVADFDFVGGSYTNFFPAVNGAHTSVLEVPSGGVPVN